MRHVRLEARGKLHKSVLILGTGFRHKVHLVGERQTTQEEPCREKTGTGHKDEQFSTISPHVR